jgi:ADP-ribose pyrophosphatase
VKHPGAVAIIAVVDGKIILVEQFRKAMERILMEIPAGKLEKNESIEASANRELEEETGYACTSMEWLISFYTSPGFADEIIHVFIARELFQQENPRGLDEDEFVNVHHVTLDEALQLVKDQKIMDAKTAFAVQYAQLHRESLGL